MSESEKLREIVKEFVRLDDESGLFCDDSSSLVILLRQAREATELKPHGIGPDAMFHN